MGTNGKWGHAGINATNQQKSNYSSKLKSLSNEQINNVDFILVDGRFRVACCLKCFDMINDECLIAFDDFVPRKQYHIVLDFFDIIDQIQGGDMVILKKKITVSSIPNSLIEKYELISD